MISFIYRIVFEFEREHGFLPNLLYLGDDHAEHLRHELSGLTDIPRFLGMNVALVCDCPQPRVAWVDDYHNTRSAAI
jgi:hypothetical protein